MKTNLFSSALAATMIALTIVSASAAGIGIGITIGPSYRNHHRHQALHHRVCHFDRFGHRHCFWR